MTSDATQIRETFADWPMSHAKRVTKDNRKNPEYHVVAAIRKLAAEAKTVHHCSSLFSSLSIFG